MRHMVLTDWCCFKRLSCVPQANSVTGKSCAPHAPAHFPPSPVGVARRGGGPFFIAIYAYPSTIGDGFGDGLGDFRTSPNIPTLRRCNCHMGLLERLALTK